MSTNLETLKTLTPKARQFYFWLRAQAYGRGDKPAGRIREAGETEFRPLYAPPGVVCAALKGWAGDLADDYGLDARETDDAVTELLLAGLMRDLTHAEVEATDEELFITAYPTCFYIEDVYAKPREEEPSLFD